MGALSTVPISVAIPVYGVAVLLVVYISLVVYRGARRLDHTPDRARSLAMKVVAALGVWFVGAILVVLTGLTEDLPGRVPWFAVWFVLAIAAGVLGVRRWPDLYGVLSNRETLAELQLSQTGRWLGAVFLILYAGGQLPGFFAYPAGWGDILVGITCIFAVMALRSTASNAIPIAWTVLGLLDFAGAVGTAVLSSRSIALVHTTPPSSAMFQLPLFLFPGFLVSISIALHIITLMLLTGPLRRRPASAPSAGVVPSLPELREHRA